MLIKIGGAIRACYNSEFNSLFTLSKNFAGNTISSWRDELILISRFAQAMFEDPGGHASLIETNILEFAINGPRKSQRLAKVYF